MNNNISILTSLSKEEFEKVIKNSNSFRKVIQYFGFTINGTSYNRIKDRIIKENIDISHFKKSIVKGKIKSIPLEKILVKNSSYNGNVTLRKRLIKEGILKEICSECGQLPIWNGKPLTLQLDHINGDNHDNRLENLRLLCPNCHTQTETYSGRNNKKKYNCSKCGKVITRHSKTGLCHSCWSNSYNKSTKKPTKEELEKLVKNNSIVSIGKLYNVSDNCIRKWCKSYKIDYKKRKSKD